jgi:hypothetical protein
MHKTPGGAGNVDTWTFSCWVKRSALSTQQRIFGVGNHSTGNPHSYLQFNTDDTLQFDNYQGGTEKIQTNRKFRDVAAWYNIVLSVDTTNGTAGNRYRLYINGIEETSFSTDNNPSVNQDTSVNSTNAFHLGSFSNNEFFFDGYIAEVCLVDGSQLAATSFGEFDEDSPTIWKPIDVSGLTFGTNGFYLDFKDSANLGNDANGGTDLTEVNLAATDQCTDTPTNNFCTMNPLYYWATTSTFSEGNTTIKNDTANKGRPATFGVKRGKWYWEVKNDNSNLQSVGIVSDTAISDGDLDDYDVANGFQGYSGNRAIAMCYDGGQLILPSSTTGSWGSTVSNDGIVQIALDLDNNKLYFGINGTWVQSGDPTSGATGTGAASITAYATTPALGDIIWFPLFHTYNTTGISHFNFGNPSEAISSSNSDADGYGNFEYAVPSGYYALCTKNLAEYG